MTEKSLKKLKKLSNLFVFIFFIIFVLQLIGLFVMFLLTPVCVEAQVTFTPQVTVPGSDFKQGAPYTEKGEGLLIAEYIQAWYKFAIAGVGILAVVMIMAGGLVWLTAGGRADQISTAKDWIMGAVIGLVLALMSYTLLDILNPNLVTFESLKIDDIKFVASNTCCFPKNGPQRPTSKGCVFKDQNGWEEFGARCNLLEACINTVDNSLYHCVAIEEGQSVCVDEKDCPENWFCVGNKCYNGSYKDPCDIDKSQSCDIGLYCKEGIVIGGVTTKKTICYDGREGDVCDKDEECNQPMACKNKTCQYSKNGINCLQGGATCSGRISGNNECCSGNCDCGTLIFGKCLCK